MDIKKTIYEESRFLDAQSARKHFDMILFARNSISNREWIEKVNTSIKEIFDKTVVHYYHHWQTGKEMINFARELEELRKYNLKEYTILAKSAGIILTLKGIKENILNPKRCFFIGTPLNWCKENNLPIESLISNHKIPTVFMQNKHDPACSGNRLKKWLKTNKIINYQKIFAFHPTLKCGVCVDFWMLNVPHPHTKVCGFRHRHIDINLFNLKIALIAIQISIK